MGVEYPHAAQVPEGAIVADRDLYLTADGSTIVEHGDQASASQFVAAGHPISKADADRLGLTVDADGKVVQDHPAKVEDLRAEYEALVAELDAINEKADAYREENATKDIPNTMEAERVALESKVEHARLALAQSIKVSIGKDQFKGESQATSLKPDEGKDPVKAAEHEAADKAAEGKPAAKKAAAKKTGRRK
jgi:hypothetical protein